jgi:hypothetical protein
MENNPNVLDSLFTPPTASCTRPASGTWSGRAAACSSTAGRGRSSRGTRTASSTRSPPNAPRGKRAAIVAEHGYDTKFAYHVVRLLGQVEQILVEGDVDLQRDSERLNAVLRGEWTEERLRLWAAAKEADLERAYAASKLPAASDEEKLKGCC